MADLLIRAQDDGDSGVFAQVSAAEANARYPGWEYLNMAVRRLNTGETYSGNTGENEYVHVIFGGECRVDTSAGSRDRFGGRTNVFTGKPHALYLSRRTDFAITALTDGFEVATCWVRTEEDHPPAWITPESAAVELRGAGNASRQITSILPPGFDCQRLVCVEVYTPGGNWSSYPPHKHDVHREADDGALIEADLEEIYFYKLNPPDGFAYQRVYNDSGTLDEVVLARQHDAVLVPEGYHPVVSAHGYTTYYLNFLAGSAQSLANSDDPAHAWVKEQWPSLGLDPRLPIVT